MLQSCVYASSELHLVRSIDSCWMLEARLPIQYALNAPESASIEIIPFFASSTSC
jgi:hypothetical protein